MTGRKPTKPIKIVLPKVKTRKVIPAAGRTRSHGTKPGRLLRGENSPQDDDAYCTACDLTINDEQRCVDCPRRGT